MDEADVAATVLKLAYTKSAVSSPSRATAKNAVIAIANGPVMSAFSILPLSSSRRPRDAERIQKTIQVTKPTASKEVVPAKNSSPLGVSSADVNVRNPPRAKLATIAMIAPAQRGAKRCLRWVLVM